MRKRLLNIYWTLQRIIVPTLQNSQSLYKNTISHNLSPKVQWLDLGCGHHILPLWHFPEEKELLTRCKSIFGIDYSLTSLKKHRSISKRIQGDISKLPLNDNSFDLVTSNMVIEHFQDPLLQFKEVQRILKPGGIFIFHTPNSLGYQALLSRIIPNFIKKHIIRILQGRKEEDIFETYYRANTVKDIQRLANSTYFQILRFKLVVTYAVTSVIIPLSIIELFFIKLLMTKTFEWARPNIIAILRNVSHKNPMSKSTT